MKGGVCRGYKHKKARWHFYSNHRASYEIYFCVTDTLLTVCGLPESFVLLILNLAESAKKRLVTAGHLDRPFPF